MNETKFSLKTYIVSLLFISIVGTSHPQCDPELSVIARDETYHYGTNAIISSVPLNPALFPLPSFLSITAGLFDAYQVGCLQLEFWGVRVPFDDSEYSWNTAIRRSASLGYSFGRDGIRVNNVRRTLTPRVASCEPILNSQMDYMTGNTSLYAFHIGTSEYPRKIRIGTWSTCRQVIVENNSDQMIFVPIHISGSVVAAESFGDPVSTYGKARLRVWGTIAGSSFDEGTGMIESVTAIPEQADVSVTRWIPVAPSRGVYSINISINAEAYTEVQAKSTGIFGLLSGSATAGVSFPESIGVGFFSGQNGSPLPSGVRIYDPEGNSFFADTRISGDVNGDGCVNDIDLLAVLFTFGLSGNNLPEDLNHDDIINDTDLLAVLFNFGSGC